ncbi:excinuclease ABC subunit UvrA [Patescibacteria group bacterium]
MKSEKIKIKGARQHNLKNVNLDIPKNKLICFTGISGSGKSSLAFDTIYAEGQRRYVESLSSYARQFLGLMEKPDVDLIEGLSPSISIDQKTTSKNPRSTVGTVTEIYDYLRLLFARVGHPHCPKCGREIQRQTSEQILLKSINLIEDILKGKKIIRFYILSPVVIDKKGEFSSLFDNLKAKGYKKVRVDGYIKDLNEDFVLIKTNKHTIEVVIDSLSFSKTDFNNKLYRDNLKSRLGQSIEQSLKLSDGLLIVSEIKDKGFSIPEYPKVFQDHLFSERFSCPVDNIQIAEIEPRTFSFNSPHGACPKCLGIGHILKVNPDIIFAKDLTILEGGIIPFSNMFEKDTWYSRLVLKMCEEEGLDPQVLVKKLENDQISKLLYGVKDKVYKVRGTNRFGKETFWYQEFIGIINELERRHKNTQSDWVRNEIEKYMKEELCPECEGSRLKSESLAVTIDKNNIDFVSNLSIKDLSTWISDLSKMSILSEREKQIGKSILKEIYTRLNFLNSVGLEYLTISRNAKTLSAGESQRIRLASQIGTGLTGVLYVLDEPTIGLHQKDNDKLIKTLKSLRDLGNTVLVVEHDMDMMKNSDYIVDFGPGAGKNGGNVVAQGSLTKLKTSKTSLTSKYLTGKRKINIESIKQDKIINTSICIKGCKQFNLKEIDVEFPLGKFIVITGVSGSGKSTLLVETLYPAIISKLFDRFKGSVGKYKSLDGVDNIDKSIIIDQSPIGKTPRSNPATYVKLFDLIREVYANTKDAKVMGFSKSRFSFNLKGGRCDACDGQGQTKIEMQFMSDIWIKCDVCAGTRYNSQTLEVEYKGKNISDILKLSVTEAKEFFHNHPKIIAKLDTLISVGLGYIELGQPATTLSGGEAQRIKLSAELSKRDTGSTLYVLDEPTTGLHFADLEKLLLVLKLLVSKGNTVIVIEHNLDVVKNADWIIDLGPEGGDLGGKIIFEGTPKSLVNTKTHTAKFLKQHLNK